MKKINEHILIKKSTAIGDTSVKLKSDILDWLNNQYCIINNDKHCYVVEELYDAITDELAKTGPFAYYPDDFEGTDGTQAYEPTIFGYDNSMILPDADMAGIKIGYNDVYLEGNDRKKCEPTRWLTDVFFLDGQYHIFGSFYTEYSDLNDDWGIEYVGDSVNEFADDFGDILNKYEKYYKDILSHNYLKDYEDKPYKRKWTTLIEKKAFKRGYLKGLKESKETFNDAWLQHFIFRPTLEACEKYRGDLEVEFPELYGFVKLAPFSSSNSTLVGIDIETTDDSDLQSDFETQIDIKEDIAQSKTMHDIVKYIRSETNKKLENSKFSNYRISKISWGGIGGSEVVKVPGVEAYFMRIYFTVEMNQEIDKASVYTPHITNSWEPSDTSAKYGVYRNDWRHDNRRG